MKAPSKGTAAQAARASMKGKLKTRTASPAQTYGERNSRNSPEYREWFGEPEGCSENRGSDNRNTGRITQSRRTSRDDDDDELQQPVAGQPPQSKRQ